MLRGIAQVITAVMSGFGAYGIFCAIEDVKMVLANRKSGESEGTEK